MSNYKFLSCQILSESCYNNEMRRAFISMVVKRKIFLILTLILSSCTQLGGLAAPPITPPTAVTHNPPAPAQTPVPSLTPFLPLSTATATPHPDLSLWIDPAIPIELRLAWKIPSDVQHAVSPESATLFWQVETRQDPGVDRIQSIPWIYALVAPFPTILDDVSFSQVQAAWKGQPSALFDGHPLLLDELTRLVFAELWGPAADGAVQVLPEEDLIQAAWNNRPAWAIVPFHKLEPGWKVISLDGQSPLSKEFQPDNYPLKANFVISGKPEQAALLRSRMGLDAGVFVTLPGNRDPNKLTVLVMTGTTALVRATAGKMETNGVTYPGRDVRDVLRDADITHISNEVSFAENCPPPNPGSTSLRFCSAPKYIGLLEDIGTKIVELSGNHVNDWGTDAFTYTLNLYKEHHIPYFAGGANQEEARQPVILEDHGNRLAFIGCNPAGPVFAWATDTEPGAARCEYDWEHAKIRELRDQGILPVVTFQYPESYDPSPLPAQQSDFKGMIDAGAEIVSGSQAHYPQGLDIYQGKLIHYGLGNLFFDQQNFIDPNTGKILEGTRWEFLDRHIIYDGRHISTELLTYMLEDWSKPRPMTPAEREALLKYIFAASGWK